jgi:hypothetical protein
MGVLKEDLTRRGPIDVAEHVPPLVRLPDAPPIALGAITFHGDVVPVMDITRRLGFLSFEISGPLQAVARTGKGR